MFFHYLKASGSFVAQLAFEECVFEPPIKTSFVFIRHFILLPGHCQSHTKLESFLAFRLEHELRSVWSFSLGPCELGTGLIASAPTTTSWTLFNLYDLRKSYKYILLQTVSPFRDLQANWHYTSQTQWHKPTRRHTTVLSISKVIYSRGNFRWLVLKKHPKFPPSPPSLEMEEGGGSSFTRNSSGRTSYGDDTLTGFQTWSSGSCSGLRELLYDCFLA